MAIIDKIDLNAIQAAIRKTVSISLDIRLLQEQLEDVINYIEANEKYFKDGKISEGIYKENKMKLEKNRKSFMSKINKTIEIGIQAAKKAQDVMGVNKI